MAKPKRKQKNRSGGKSGGSSYTPGPVDREQVLSDLESKITEIDAAQGDQLGPLFGEVHKLLLKTDADKREAMQLIGMRDVGGLKKLLATLRGDAPADVDGLYGDAVPAESDSADGPAIDPETMKKAMRAFRKRLKLVRLDHESKLGVGPMTGGRKADVDAIMAPREFPTEVWEALVASGELKHVGREFYQLTSES